LDLESYQAGWHEPARIRYRGLRLGSRRGLADVLGALELLPELRSIAEPDRALALVGALDGPGSGEHTTNLVTADADGNACVLTTSLGLGSGDYLPGLDLHLNSMLGERDLVRGPLEPGERMESMMSPLLARDDSGPVLAAGAAGGTRLRSALVQVVAGVLDEGLEPEDAVGRPRLHPAGRVVHLEPGFDESVAAALEHEGFEPREWAAPHHYFGGVSVITRTGAAGDPRRSGAARPPRSG
jgi:gamma-glutamyltranspeptidase/glutathione hydrolase